MAGVQIDIPGIGTVEANNAATDATLREILKAIKGDGGGSDEKKPITVMGSLLKRAIGDPDKQSRSQKFLGKAAENAGAGLGKISKAVAPVVGGLVDLSKFLGDTVNQFANVGDDIERASATIPILGDLFKAVASSSVRVNDAFLAASKSGASFGGSVRELASAASAAGMTMDKFASLVARNGEGMLGFGSTTEEGAKRFSQVSKALRSASGDLYALGFSTEDINQGLASYGDLLRKQGLQGTKSNAELVSGAQKYLKEIDALAKLTGEERAVKEAQMKQLATDAQFQMSMAGKSEETRASFMKLIGGFGPTLGGFVKDFIATGTVTTEENQRIAAALGGPTMNELTKLRQKLQNNQQLSDEEQDRLRAIMKKASEAGAKQLGGALAASRENDAMSKAYIEGMQIQVGAVKKTAEEQRKAALEGSGFNKKMQEIQQQLAGFSNTFRIALANSGILDFLMKTFTVLATLVQSFLIPAFTLVAGIIGTLGSALASTILPIFQGLGSIINDHLYPAFLDLAAFVIVDVIEPLKELGSQIMDKISPALEWMGQVMKEYVTPIFEGIGEFIKNNLQPIMLGLAAGIGAVVAYYAVKNAVLIAGTIAQGAYNLAVAAGAAAMALLTSPIFLVIAGIAAVVTVFKKLYDSGWNFKTIFDAVGDNFERFGLTILDFIDNLRSKLPPMLGGLSEEEAKARKEEREEAKKALDQKEQARDTERANIAKERANSEDAQKRAKVAKDLDAKILAQKSRYGAGIGKTADKVEDANKTIDYNSGPEALLKQFSAKEGGLVELGIKKDEAGKEKSAADKEYAEAKTTAEKKAALAKVEEAEKKIAALEKAIELSKKGVEGRPINKTTEAASKAEPIKKEVEKQGEEKAAAEKKAAEESKINKKIEEEKQENQNKGRQPVQESAESLLAQLNSNMSQLIRISQEQKDIGERQLSVQRSLTKDLFVAV